MFTLTFDDTWADESLDIQIFDMYGRQIQMIQGAARSGGEVQLSVRQWPAGVYIVQVTGREKQEILKLVVKQ